VGEPKQHGCEDEAATVDDGMLVVSGGQPAPVFEAVEGASMTDITTHASFLPHNDPEVSSPEVNRLGLIRRTEVLRNG
jgi:hypothetical protein